MKNVLFVCTGNTCRSSMAEAMFRTLAHKAELDTEVSSAGTTVFFQGGASWQAVEVMAKKGIDISGHVSRPVIREYIEKADLILTMTRAHKRAVQDMAPEFSDKVFTLKEFAYDSLKGICDEAGHVSGEDTAAVDGESRDGGGPKDKTAGKGNGAVDGEEDNGCDISDPFGGTVDVYRTCSREIEEALIKTIEKLKAKNKGREEMGE